MCFCYVGGVNTLMFKPRFTCITASCSSESRPGSGKMQGSQALLKGVLEIRSVDCYKGSAVEDRKPEWVIWSNLKTLEPSNTTLLILFIPVAIPAWFSLVFWPCSSPLNSRLIFSVQPFLIAQGNNGYSFSLGSPIKFTIYITQVAHSIYCLVLIVIWKDIQVIVEV